jgi:hypothetical protein
MLLIYKWLDAIVLALVFFVVLVILSAVSPLPPG